MSRLAVFGLLSLIALCSAVPLDFPCFPNQIHLSYGDAYYNVMYNYDFSLSGNPANNSAMVVWQTNTTCTNNYLMVFPTSNPTLLQNITIGEMYVRPFEAEITDLSESYSDVIGIYNTTSYTAYLNNLVYGTNYSFLVSNGQDTVGPFSFILPNPNPTNQQMKFIIYGDVDTADGNVTLNAFQNIYNQNRSAITAQLLLGDIGYNIYNNLGLRGEYFFNTVQNFSNTWPLMITPGNHEWYMNFTFLTFRTSAPLQNYSDSHYYSWNMGLVHFIAINMDYYNMTTPPLQQQMMNWINNDLKQANKTRNVRPWIIVVAHRSIYCSYSLELEFPDDRCYNFYSMYQNFDQIFYAFRVDLVLQAHVHYWERMGPIANNVSMPYFSPPGDTGRHYIINPTAPVYTTDGSAGNNYFMIQVPTPPMPYSINIDCDFAYSTLTIVNESVLLYEHITSETGAVFDYFYLMKGDNYSYPEGYGPMKDTPPEQSSSSLGLIILGFFVVLVITFLAWRLCFSKKAMNARSRINIINGSAYRPPEYANAI